MYYKYIIDCPNCTTRLSVIVSDTIFFIIKCEGCGEIIVVDDCYTYTVSQKFFLKIVKKYSFKWCGSVIDYNIRRFDEVNSPTNSMCEKESISDSAIQELRFFLKKSTDSADIFNKYW